MAKKNFVGPKGARLLRRVAKHILAEPLRYEQDEIITRGEPGDIIYCSESRRMIPACGTVACIGGWMALLTAKDPRRVRSFNIRKLSSALGVPVDNIFPLVAYTWTESGGWPEQFRAQYVAAKDPKTQAKIAAARIEHFIKTGE